MSCVVFAGVAPLAWSAPVPAPSSADTPVADGTAEPTTENEALSSAEVRQPGASIASTGGATLTSLPSRVLPTGDARMVGLTWTDQAPQTMEMRSQNPDGSWTDWTQVEAADGEEGAVKASEPVWIGASHNIEVRAVRGGQDVGGELTAVLIEAPTTESEARLDVDPNATLATEQPAGASTAGTAGASTAAALPVPVISRAGWGANESWKGGAPDYHAGVRAATIHHTASTNSYSKSQSAAQVRSFYSYHTRTLGWNDIGYNVLVDKYGQVFEGRAGGLSRPVWGAHAGGFNRYTFGISMIGNYSSVTPSSVMVENVSKMIAWKFKISGITSGWGNATLLSEASNVKYRRGSTPSLPRVFAHRDVGYTSCPGNAGYAKMNTVRGRVTSLLANYPASSNPAPAPSTSLKVPSMSAGQYVKSADGVYRLTMQTDGNLVLRKGSSAQWSSRTYLPGGKLLVQSDGNVVIYDASGRARWHTATAGRSNPRFALNNDGNLVLYSGSTPVWDRRHSTAGRETRVQTTFTSLRSTPVRGLNGAYRVSVEANGNLVVRTNAGKAVWSSGTRGTGARLQMQADGNMVLRNSAGRAIWSTRTAGRPGAKVFLRDSGKMTIYHGGREVWTT